MQNTDPNKDGSLVVIPVSRLHEIVQKSVQKALKSSLPKILKRASLSPFLTTSELSKLASWSESKIFYMRQEGRIKYIQEGRSIVYPTEWILDYLEKHAITPNEDVLEELYGTGGISDE